ETPYLTLGEVDRRYTAMAELRGAGSATTRRDHLGKLLALATPPEQRFLSGLTVGEVRQGALDGLVVEAIAKAAELPADSVRRAGGGRVRRQRSRASVSGHDEAVWQERFAARRQDAAVARAVRDAARRRSDVDHRAREAAPRCARFARAGQCSEAADHRR